MGSKVGLNLGKGHSKLGQSSGQGGSTKGKKWNNLDATFAYAIQILETILPSDSPKDGARKGNNPNQETLQQDKESEKMVNKVSPTIVDVVLLSNTSPMLKSLPWNPPMKMDLHGGEGKEVAEKGKRLPRVSK